MSLPLQGLRVIDLSRVLAGPYCTMMLGDLGADVVKVEEPTGGDGTRQWGPPWAGGESAYYLSINRNKRSMTLNFKSEAGRQVLLDLLRDADVLVENFRLGTMEEWGLGYEQLSARFPQLVYARITAYGATGPYQNLPGYDFLIQALCGLMSVTGEPEGQPMKVGVPIVDITAGMLLCSAILAAVRERDLTGRGRQVDISLLEAQIAWLANVGSNYLVSGELPRRYGNGHPNVVPYQTWRTSDGWLAMGAGNDLQFGRLCEAVGHPEWARDPRFARNADRVANRDVLIGLIQQILSGNTMDHWTAVFLEYDIPCAPINTLDRVFQDPQVLERKMVVEIPHPTAGKVKLTGIPFKLDGESLPVRRHPPLNGEHTREVLKGIGYTAEQIEILMAAGAL